MKHAAWMTLVLLAAALVSGYVAEFGSHQVRAVAAPPLKLDAYLDEKLPEAPEKKSEMKVDNFACYVCHGNYEDEELVLSHGKEEVGCIDCHGKSYPHRNDEDNITPARQDVPAWTPLRRCAATVTTPTTRPPPSVLARWQERCPGEKGPQANRLHRLPLQASFTAADRPCGTRRPAGCSAATRNRPSCRPKQAKKDPAKL